MSTHPTDPLEQRLQTLAHEIDWPSASAAFVPRVLDAIATTPPRSSLSSRLRSFAPTPRWSALAVTLVLGVLALAVLLALVPGVRTGVAERLGLPGVSIAPIASTPVVPVGTNLLLGTPITFAEVSDTPSYRPLAPPATLDAPDSIWSLNRGGYQQVSYVWQRVDGLATPDSDLPSLLISQFQGTLNSGLMGKLLAPGTSVSALEINGQLAFWIEGAPHVLFYEDARGEFSEDTVRMAQNVLLWQSNDRIVRLEGALNREQAEHIAEAMTRNVAP